MKSLLIEGTKLNFLDLNESLPNTILFLHGNSHSLKSFAKQMNSPLLNNYRLVLVDMPGHGESSKDGNYSLINFAKLLNELIQTLELKNVVVAGHSLGGHLALNLLKYFSPSGLFLFGTPPLKNPFDPEAFIPNAKVKALQQTDSSMDEIEELMSEMQYTGEDLTLSITDYLNTDPRFRLGILGDVISGTNENELNLINSYQGNVMILLATNDSLINNKYITDNLKGTENIKLKEIASGHSPHIETPGVFNELLGSFCSDLFEKTLSHNNRINNKNSTREYEL